jgi:hypothetical protein
MPFLQAGKEKLAAYATELEAHYGADNIETTFAIRYTVLF